MTEFIEKYFSPFIGYGFKILFGEETNKDLLMDFLNELLKTQQGQIINITYLKALTDDGKPYFDILGENVKGEKFIAELHKSKHNFSKNKTEYCSNFPIRKRAKRSEWNFEVKAVYTIAIIDFIFKEDKEQPEKYRYDVKLIDSETNTIFYDKLTFIYLEMPKFNKSPEQLKTRLDKWLYLIRNLSRIDKIPEELKEPIFDKLFKIAEVARFNPQQLEYYEESLKIYRDLNNSFDTARQEGKKIGLAKMKLKYIIEVALNAKRMGMTVAEISKLTGLTEKEINELKVKN